MCFCVFVFLCFCVDVVPGSSLVLIYRLPPGMQSKGGKRVLMLLCTYVFVYRHLVKNQPITIRRVLISST